MSNSRVDVSVMYPGDGRTYDVVISLNYDVIVSSDAHKRIHVDIQSRKKDFDRTSARLTVTPHIARWLGLALLRASLQDEQEQRLEVRADRFPNDHVA
jgi:hypothetical protein